MKNIKRIICVITVLTFLVLPTPVSFADEEIRGFSENFSAMTVGKQPQGFNISSGWGSVLVGESEGNKYLHIKTDNDGAYVTVSREFEALMGTVTAKTDFMQENVKSDNNVIMQLLEDSTVVCSVETKDGNIIYKGISADTVLVSGYEVGRFYNIHVEIDTENGVAAIFTDGEKKAENIPLYNARSKVNVFKSYAFMSPGFILDNIYTAPSEVISHAEITGKDTQSIPGDTAAYSYEVTAYTASGMAVEAASFDFSTEPACEGVSLEAVSGKSAKITVTNSAAADTQYKIKAVLTSDSTVTAEKTITLKNAVFDHIEIEGNGVIPLYLSAPGDEHKYIAAAIDEFGNPMSSETFTWEMGGDAAEYFSMSANGTLKVLRTADLDSFIEIKAELASDPSKAQTKRIRLSDVKTYLNDMTRRAVVKEYLDTALEYAKDTYNGSPRLADGITKDGTHVLWHFPNGDKVPLADMGNEWALLRSMIAFSDTGGEPYYKDRAYELYKFTMENDLSPNNLVYWGSHAAIDLRNGKFNNQMGNYHEIEMKDMYFVPFYEIDEAKAIEMVKAIWKGHVIDWETLMFNRHAYFTKRVSDADTWDNLDQYDEDYYLDDPYIRVYEGTSFFLAASEYISAAVELYNRTGNINALTWARRMVQRYANLADPKTGIMPTLYNTPYGDPNTVPLPDWVLELDDMPYSYKSGYYGDRVYVQFADDMAAKGLITEDEKKYILEMYYNRNWPWAYDANMFSVLELVEAMGLEDESDEGYELFKLWMHGYKAYIDLAYEGNATISVSFAHGIKLDNYVTVVPGYTSRKGSVLDRSNVDVKTIVPAVAAIYKMDKFPELQDEKQVVWDFVRSMTDYYGIGDVGQPTEGVMPDLNLHTTNSDANALDAMLELYRHTGIEDYLTVARIIGNNIVEQEYDAGFFVPANMYSSWTSTHYSLVLLKLDAIINGTWSDALNFSFESYIYHQTYFVDDHGKVPTDQHSDKYWEAYTDVLPRKVRVDKTEIKMNVGETLGLNVTVLPDDAASKGFYWEIPDQGVVKIDDQNNIYAVGRGEVYIRAVINDTAIESEDIHIIVE